MYPISTKGMVKLIYFWVRPIKKPAQSLKRLGEQWTQHTVRGAFRPTILPICKGTACPTVFQKVQPDPDRDMVSFSETHSVRTVPLQIFNGLDSWLKGTHDTTTQITVCKLKGFFLREKLKNGH